MGYHGPWGLMGYVTNKCILSSWCPNKNFNVNHSQWVWYRLKKTPKKYVATVLCQVKSITAIFDDSSVYGSREGVYPCLLVTANEKHNVYHKTKCWKQASIKGISMLPRSEMLKVDRNDSFFAGNDRFTRVQELKQAGSDNKYQTYAGNVCCPKNTIHFKKNIIDFSSKTLSSFNLSPTQPSYFHQPCHLLPPCSTVPAQASWRSSWMASRPAGTL